MATDALAPCVTRSSPTMVLTMQDKEVLVFGKEEFQLPELSQCFKMVENANDILIFLNYIHHNNG